MWLISQLSALSLKESFKPRASDHIRTECLPVQERHGQLRLAPSSNLILSMTSSLERSIIFLASGTLVVKHPGSNCLYLKGRLKRRLSGFQTDKVHWNRASANLQFGFFHSLVLSLPLSKKEGFGFWPSDFGFKAVPILLGHTKRAFLGVSAVLCLLVELELSP